MATTSGVPAAFQASTTPNVTLHFHAPMSRGTVNAAPAPSAGGQDPQVSGQRSPSSGFGAPPVQSPNDQIRSALVQQMTGPGPSVDPAYNTSPPATSGVDPAYNVPPPPAALGADPAYNAFLANLGLTDADLRNAAALKTNTLNNQLGSTLTGLDQGMRNSAFHNENVFAGRGLVNSSDSLNADAGIRSAYGSREAAARDATANAIANLYTNLALQLANGQRSAATAGVNSLGNQSIASALAGPNPFIQAVSPSGS